MRRVWSRGLGARTPQTTLGHRLTCRAPRSGLIRVPRTPAPDIALVHRGKREVADLLDRVHRVEKAISSAEAQAAAVQQVVNEEMAAAAGVRAPAPAKAAKADRLVKWHRECTLASCDAALATLLQAATGVRYVTVHVAPRLCAPTSPHGLRDVAGPQQPLCFTVGKPDAPYHVPNLT